MYSTAKSYCLGDDVADVVISSNTNKKGTSPPSLIFYNDVVSQALSLLVASYDKDKLEPPYKNRNISPTPNVNFS